MIPQVHGDIITCPNSFENLFALEGKNIIFTYSLSVTSLENCSIRESSRLTVNESKNAICFSSGYRVFLGASGIPGSLYHLENGKFQSSDETNEALKGSIFCSLTNFDSSSQILIKFSSEIGEAIWIENLPIDTYRDESLLIVQSADKILRIFSWKGKYFHKIGDLRGLKNVYLSLATMIPNLGFIFGTKFVKISTKMTSSYDQLESLFSDQLHLQVS